MNKCVHAYGAAVDIVAESALKFANQSVYIKYDKDDPDTILPTGPGLIDAVNLRTRVENKSGVSVDAGTVVWQPIPKINQGWGDLTWGCQNASGTLSTTPPFSMILTNAVSLPPALAGKWKVEYGVGITPPAS